MYSHKWIKKILVIDALPALIWLRAKFLFLPARSFQLFATNLKPKSFWPNKETRLFPLGMISRSIFQCTRSVHLYNHLIPHKAFSTHLMGGYYLDTSTPKPPVFLENWQSSHFKSILISKNELMYIPCDHTSNSKLGFQSKQKFIIHISTSSF